MGSDAKRPAGDGGGNFSTARDSLISAVRWAFSRTNGDDARGDAAGDGGSNFPAKISNISLAAKRRSSTDDFEVSSGEDAAGKRVFFTDQHCSDFPAANISQFSAVKEGFAPDHVDEIGGNTAGEAGDHFSAAIDKHGTASAAGG